MLVFRSKRQRRLSDTALEVPDELAGRSCGTCSVISTYDASQEYFDRDQQGLHFVEPCQHRGSLLAVDSGHKEQEGKRTDDCRQSDVGHPAPMLESRSRELKQVIFLLVGQLVVLENSPHPLERVVTRRWSGRKFRSHIATEY